MLTWKDVLAQQERYTDLRREAEQDRLLRQALADAARTGAPSQVALRYARYGLAALAALGLVLGLAAHV